jgi:endogenous inhibitor of DNA gyrase (YacG/DUF329 family)
MSERGASPCPECGAPAEWYEILEGEGAAVSPGCRGAELVEALERVTAIAQEALARQITATAREALRQQIGTISHEALAAFRASGEAGPDWRSLCARLCDPGPEGWREALDEAREALSGGPGPE